MDTGQRMSWGKCARSLKRTPGIGPNTVCHEVWVRRGCSCFALAAASSTFWEIFTSGPGEQLERCCKSYSDRWSMAKRSGSGDGAAFQIGGHENADIVDHGEIKVVRRGSRGFQPLGNELPPPPPLALTKISRPSDGCCCCGSLLYRGRTGF